MIGRPLRWWQTDRKLLFSPALSIHHCIWPLLPLPSSPLPREAGIWKTVLSGQEEPRPEGQGPFPLARGAGRSCRVPIELQLICSQSGGQAGTHMHPEAGEAIGQDCWLWGEGSPKGSLQVLKSLALTFNHSTTRVPHFWKSWFSFFHHPGLVEQVLFSVQSWSLQNSPAHTVAHCPVPAHK